MAFLGRPRMGCPTVSPGGTFDLGEAQWHVGVAFPAATQMEPKNSSNLATENSKETSGKYPNDSKYTISYTLW